jgi:hypothetical protein
LGAKKLLTVNEGHNVGVWYGKEEDDFMGKSGELFWLISLDLSLSFSLSLWASLKCKELWDSGYR